MDDLKSCAKMNIFGLTGGYGWEGIDGIVGLSTGNPPLTEGDLLVKKLHEQGLIEKPIFAFYLSGTEGESFLDIGRLQSGALISLDDMVWIDVLSRNFWWTNYIEGIKFTGADGTVAQYAVKKTKALTDSGTSCVYMPYEYYDSVLHQIQKYALRPELVDISWDGEIAVKCDIREELPVISFLFGGYWMEMRPEDYIVEYEGFCFACLGKGDYGVHQEWLLGDAFLRGFYSAHDYSSMKFGFAPHSKSQKNAPIAGTPPYNNPLQPTEDFPENIRTPTDEPRPIRYNDDNKGLSRGAKFFILLLILSIIIVVIAYVMSKSSKLSTPNGLEVVIL